MLTLSLAAVVVLASSPAAARTLVVPVDAEELPGGQRELLTSVVEGRLIRNGHDVVGPSSLAHYSAMLHTNGECAAQRECVLKALKEMEVQRYLHVGIRRRGETYFVKLELRAADGSVALAAVQRQASSVEALIAALGSAVDEISKQLPPRPKRPAEKEAGSQ